MSQARRVTGQRPRHAVPVGVAAAAVASAALIAMLALADPAATPWIMDTPATAWRMAVCMQVHDGAACGRRVPGTHGLRVAVITPGDGTAVR